ncbi:Uncharacterized protein GNX_2379 [Leptospira interrogans serovar Canicola]|nr:Uncharacterized protein GNX_2379 [Leptospira interrogans serovar Canicola]
MDGEIDEDGLINFLKKFGKNDIYSFMVRNQEDKYTFPILITKRYLKKKRKGAFGKSFFGHRRTKKREYARSRLV